MKIIGLKKAVGEYNKANSGGYLSPFYGKLMYDMSTGKIWTDTFYSLGHNSWKEYHDKSIICLSDIIREKGYDEKITMKFVTNFIENNL